MIKREPSIVCFFYHMDEIKEAAEKILLEETGMKVEVSVCIEDNDAVYLELHHNSDEVIDKLCELGFDVHAPIEDTTYLLEKISGFKDIEFEHDVDGNIEIRVPFDEFKKSAKEYLD